jgi:hypothetical protein
MPSIFLESSSTALIHILLGLPTGLLSKVFLLFLRLLLFYGESLSAPHPIPNLGFQVSIFMTPRDNVAQPFL